MWQQLIEASSGQIVSRRRSLEEFHRKRFGLGGVLVAQVVVRRHLTLPDESLSELDAYRRLRHLPEHRQLGQTKLENKIITFLNDLFKMICLDDRF